jgi:hypothetical protein
MKGISQFIAVILLIAISVAIGAIVSLWYSGLISKQAGEVEKQIEKATECSFGGIRILAETIRCDFSGNGTPSNPDNLNFTVENSGSINLYDLRVQILVSGLVYTFDVLDAQNNLTFSSNYPLRPDESKTVKANITKDLPLADAEWIKLITQCSGVNSGYIRDIDCTP